MENINPYREDSILYELFETENSAVVANTSYTNAVAIITQWVDLENRESKLPAKQAQKESSFYDELMGSLVDPPARSKMLGSSNHTNLKGAWDEMPTLSERLADMKVEPADYILSLFDESEEPDPIGIHGITSHYERMTQLERWISESCYAGAKVSRVQDAVHDGKLFWQRQEYIARKLECDEQTASKLIEAFVELNFGTDQVMWALKIIAQRSVHAGFVYFTDLAEELNKVTLTEAEANGIIEEESSATDEKQKHSNIESSWVARKLKIDELKATSLIRTFEVLNFTDNAIKFAIKEMVASDKTSHEEIDYYTNLLENINENPAITSKGDEAMYDKKIVTEQFIPLGKTCQQQLKNQRISIWQV